MDAVVYPDGLLDLEAAVLKLAVDDVKRGPGWDAKQQRDYATARQFLDAAGVLERVLSAYHIVDVPPVQAALFDLCDLSHEGIAQGEEV